MWPFARPAKADGRTSQALTELIESRFNVVAESIHNSPITYNFNGLDEKGLRDALKRVVAEVAGSKAVPIPPLEAVLAKLGQSGVAPDDIPARLSQAADELVRLRALMQTAPGGDPELAEIRKRASGSLDKGEFAQARDILAEGRRRAKERKLKAATDEAGMLAAEAGVYTLESNFRMAAERYGEAAATVAEIGGRVYWLYLFLQLSAMQHLGVSQLGTKDQDKTVEVARNVAALAKRDKDTRLAAHALAALGSSLSHAGSLSRNKELLEEAVQAFQEALKINSRTSSPFYWAEHNHNMGLALSAIFKTTHSLKALSEAESAIRSSLLVWTVEAEPKLWRHATASLCDVKFLQAEAQSSTDLFKDVVAACDKLLGCTNRRQFTEQWASAMRIRGKALLELGASSNDMALLEQAVSAFNGAAEETPRSTDPLHWAEYKFKLASALWRIGVIRNDVGCLQSAKHEVEAALEEWRRDYVPMQWATAHEELGHIGLILSVYESGTASLLASAAAYNAAIEVYSAKPDPRLIAPVQANLGHVYMLLAEREAGTSSLDKAVSALEASVKNYERIGTQDVRKAVALLEEAREKLPTRHTAGGL